jgi:hypothetical protein
VDARRFDRLSRAVGVTASRRALVAAVVGGGLAAVAPAARAARCGRRQVRCNGRCVRKKSLPCCPGGNCTIVDVCLRTTCPPAAVFKNVKLTVENRTGNAFSLEFWNKKNLACHKGGGQSLANGATAEFASDAMNGFAWIAGRYGVEVNNPLIGTPFVSMVQDGRMNDTECYVPGSLITGAYSLLEGEGVRRGMGSLSFEVHRRTDTDDDKIFVLTVHPG